VNASSDAAILALDIGTSSSRAVLYDALSGEAVPGAIFSIHHEQASTPDGGATLDADTLVSEAAACAHALLGKGHPPIAAVAVSTFWHSFVGVDAHGKARTPVLLWSDRRSHPQVERLRDVLDGDAYPQRTGCPIHTSYLPGRLCWLAETDPATFDACARFVSPGEYLFAQVFGLERVTCSISMASASGLMDQANGAWDTETLAHVPGLTPERLSPIRDEAVRGDLRAPFKDNLAALADVPWFPAYGDGRVPTWAAGRPFPAALRS
jgi:gluconokinase